MWIDTHCHLDAGEFDADRAAVVERALAASVRLLVLPAVDRDGFERVRELARRCGFAYALGIHPLAVRAAADADLERLDEALAANRSDPRLVAVGEIGIDAFDPDPDPQRQERFYEAQLALARRHALPVLLHVRRSADRLLKGLRRHAVPGGIVHAFNGSPAQAAAFVARGFRLGFGGAMTFERALRIRHLAAQVPEHVPVLETDAPDIPPQWLYRTAAERARGATSRNEPAELPRIASTLAALRRWSLEETAARTAANACAALPRLAALLPAAAAAAAPGQPA
jgi:TatD DNase family protein